MSFEKIVEAIKNRDIDKILTLFSKVEKKHYDKLTPMLEEFYNREMKVYKTVYNLNLYYYNRTVQKKTPREGCYEYLYINEGKTKYKQKNKSD